ncbi:hypothetical protein FSARC_1602 [Fusarium sarcochroum]|uniref:Uncharacterized protein n=1 Tax=Fusarium sarcochroum TaxID=1208366 RepID=A0A8H4U8V2_9HYPO|nr:hypothetical protein FSARC_1602 [Fusarium sarcochroum]
MDFFASFANLFIGFFCILRGLAALCRPQGEFAIIGIQDRRASDDDASSSPIFMLGVRDVSIGFFIIIHQFLDNPIAVATILLLLACFKLGDSVVVFADGDENKRTKAAGHLVACLVLLAWTVYIAMHFIQSGSAGRGY